MREISPVFLEIAHCWAWLLRTGSMQYEETLEPNSVIFVWLSDMAVKKPPGSIEDWNNGGDIFKELVSLPAEAVRPMWRTADGRDKLLELFAESLVIGPWNKERKRPADMVVHLIDTPPIVAGMKGGFEIRIHCIFGTFLSVTTLGQDVKSQLQLIPDGLIRVDGPLAIDEYLRRYE